MLPSMVYTSKTIGILPEEHLSLLDVRMDMHMDMQSIDKNKTEQNKKRCYFLPLCKSFKILQPIFRF